MSTEKKYLELINFLEKSGKNFTVYHYKEFEKIIERRFSESENKHLTKVSNAESHSFCCAIKEEYYNKKVKLIDNNGKEWGGIVKEITPAGDSENGENYIVIEYAGGLTEFAESDIKRIEIIK